MANSALAPSEEDILMMLAAGCHIGTRNMENDMREYIHKRGRNLIYIINLQKTWEKLTLAARVIVAIENPEDVCVVSARPWGQRASYKFGQYSGSHVVSGRYTPGTFTNQICRNYVEPRVLLVTDPRTDAQPVKEASYVNIPVIAFCDTDSPLDNIDIAIPCNNKGKNSIAVMYWLLAREVLRMRASISRKEDWEVQVDLFIYKDPEEAEQEAQAQEEHAAIAAQQAASVAQPPQGGSYEEQQGAFYDEAPKPNTGTAEQQWQQQPKPDGTTEQWQQPAGDQPDQQWQQPQQQQPPQEADPAGFAQQQQPAPQQQYQQPFDASAQDQPPAQPIQGFEQPPAQQQQQQQTPGMPFGEEQQWDSQPAPASWNA